MTNKKFVGRNKELIGIRDWLQRPSSRLVLITGMGGIGKTSLLQKVREEYFADSQFVIDYFDLAEQPVAMINQAVHLANSIGFENFPEFKRKINDLVTQSSELTQIDQSQIDEAVDTCIWEADTYLKAQNKRLLLITDTFEIALKYNFYKDDRVKKIYGKLSNIPGTCFVIAGRDKSDDITVTEEVYPLMRELFGQENILYLHLSGFDGSEMDDFFGEFDEHQMIPPVMREKLHLLTAGRPILLLLAIEWLKKNIPLPVMIEKSLPELEGLMASEDARMNLLDSFEFELVSRVRQLQSPLDIAVLYMAHINRRMDEKLLAILLDMNNLEAQNVLMSLLRLSFVKEFVGATPPKCALHDEMCVLVNKFAWRYLDISGEERKRLTRKVIDDYYRPLVESRKQEKYGLLPLAENRSTLLQRAQAGDIDWERWLLEAETVYYSTKLSQGESFACFDRFFYNEERSNIRDQFLIDELKRARLNKDKIALRDADFLCRRNEFEKARQICLEIFEKGDSSESDRLHAASTLGVIDLERNPIAAEKSFKQALQLAVAMNDIRLQVRIHNNLGRLFRNISQLEPSIAHFKQALDLVRESKNLEMAAAILNNLAWTYRLNGNLDEADASCRISIAENRRQGQDRPLAYSYLTKADIDRDRGDLPSAQRHAKLAFEIFRRLDKRDYEGEAQTYRTMANISRHLRDFDQALKYLRTAISLVSKKSSPRLLASLYQSYGRTCRHYAEHLQAEQDFPLEGTDNKPRTEESSLFEDALIALEDSVRLARQIGNRWEIARSQVEIAWVTMLKQESYDETQLNNLLEEVWQTAIELENDLLIGYVYENRALIELRHKRYFEAGQAFGAMARHTAKRTGQESTRAFSRLHNILLDDPLRNEERDSLARGVLEQLPPQDCQDSQPLIALVDMCQQILTLPI